MGDYLGNGGELFFVGGLFFEQALGGACFHGLFGLAESGDAVFAALDFLGDGEAVLERGAVGVLGFLEELGDLLAGEFHLFDGVAVADGAVFAGVGEDFGAIDGDGDVADLEDFGAGGELENLVKGVGEEVFIFAAELADRVVIGVGVAGEETDGDVFVGEFFDASAGENACRVGVDQQAEHHGGWVLGVRSIGVSWSMLTKRAGISFMRAGGRNYSVSLISKSDRLLGRLVWYP
jgi:hypothetical protein